MSFDLGFNLTIEQTQKLVMTQELIQGIQILQYNSQELEAYISEEILLNPVIEKEESVGTESDCSNDSDWEEIIRQRQYDDIGYRNSYDSSDEEAGYYENYVSSEETLSGYLMFQLGIAAADDRLCDAGEFIIESIDDNGYFTLTIEDVVSKVHVSQTEAENALKLIQTFDPMGVGARDIRECIMIQLEQMGLASAEFQRLVSEHFEDIAGNKISSIAKAMGEDKQKIQCMIDIIKELEPKPGRRFLKSRETGYITPDVIIEKNTTDFV